MKQWDYLKIFDMLLPRISSHRSQISCLMDSTYANSWLDVGVIIILWDIYGWSASGQYGEVCLSYGGCIIFPELELRQQKGQIQEDTILLTVEDPRGSVGSGGATLNALLVVCEHISAKRGYTVSDHYSPQTRGSSDQKRTAHWSVTIHIILLTISLWRESISIYS